MNQPKYLYKSEELLKVYEFVSEGLKGNVKKVVQFTETGTQNVYNLAFGDFNDTTNLIDDLSITNNLVEIKKDFEVYGLTEDGNWAEFITGEDYEAFLITKKDNTFAT
jgi:hypothetical protein